MNSRVLFEHNKLSQHYEGIIIPTVFPSLAMWLSREVEAGEKRVLLEPSEFAHCRGQRTTERSEGPHQDQRILATFAKTKAARRSVAISGKVWSQEEELRTG